MPPVTFAVTFAAFPSVTEVAEMVELFASAELPVTVTVNTFETTFEVESFTRTATS